MLLDEDGSSSLVMFWRWSEALFVPQRIPLRVVIIGMAFAGAGAAHQQMA
jgi:hypothetical protein